MFIAYCTHTLCREVRTYIYGAIGIIVTVAVILVLSITNQINPISGHLVTVPVPESALDIYTVLLAIYS